MIERTQVVLGETIPPVCGLTQQPRPFGIILWHAVGFAVAFSQQVLGLRITLGGKSGYFLPVSLTGRHPGATGQNNPRKHYRA